MGSGSELGQRANALTDADHDRRIYLVRLVLARSALDPEVCPEEALADLGEVFAGKSLENLVKANEDRHGGKPGKCRATTNNRV